MTDFEFRHDNVKEWPYTPPLNVFRKLFDEDDNIFWRMDSGDALNLLEEAMDRLDDAEGFCARAGRCLR